MTTRRFPSIYGHRKDGYSGFIPDLPGCMASGDSLSKARENIKGAVDAFIADTFQGHCIDHWIVGRMEVLHSKSGHPVRVLKAKHWEIDKARTADPSLRRRRDSLRMTTRKGRKKA